MKNSIQAFAAASNLKVSAVVVDKMNQVIFDTSFVPGLVGSDIQKTDKGVFRINVRSNSADKLTPKSVSDNGKAQLLDGKGGSDADVAIRFGLVKGLTFAVADEATSGCAQSVLSLAKDLGLEITDVELAAQNDIIFQTTGIKNISGLDKHDGKYYKLDTVANTAQIIDADAIAVQAKKDIMAGKSTDLTSFCQQFNLITALKMAVKVEKKA